MVFLIKYVSLTFCGLFVFVKILGYEQLTFSKVVLGIVSSISFPFLLYMLPALPTSTILIAIILFSALLSKILTDYRVGLCITATIISYGIAYGSLLIATTISSILLSVISLYSTNALQVTSLACIINFGMLNIPFRLKRLRKGFLFLQEKEAGGIGLFISGLIFIGCILTGYTMNNLIVVIFIIGIPICIIGMIYWWRRGLTMLYRERQKDKTVKEYEVIIIEKDKQIQSLIDSNDFLSKIIHRDNKLIPAMYRAVTDYLDSVRGEIDNQTQEKSEQILVQLNEIMKERSEMISMNQKKYKALPTTKVDIIDSIMNHLLFKAIDNDIQFDLVLFGSVRDMTESVIRALRLETLLADIIENAIIATTESPFKRVLVSIGIKNDFYELTVQDSGFPFEIDTLLRLGLERVTTHEDDGGSGIGYTTTFEILHETGASLVIEEYEPKSYFFSKAVIIRFDNKNEYLIQTYRADSFGQRAERSDMKIITRKPIR